jgi:predicted RNA-binding Zn ribbon-like protein
MPFAHDLCIALVNTVDLINTSARGREALPDVPALDTFVAAHGFAAPDLPDLTGADLDQVLRLRPRLRAAWQASTTRDLVETANALMSEGDARPWLTDHDGWRWHLHVTRADQPLVQRISAQVGMALADMVRLEETSRLRTCAGEDCDAVVVDLSRNQSRLYCDVGNCGNRVHVAAYRARNQGRGKTASA